VRSRDGVFDLLERVWGERPDRRELEWWFDQAPAGPGLLTTEEDGERVVGLASMSFLRVRTRGGESMAAMPLQVGTDPAYRGRGIFARLERQNEETAASRGHTIGLTFPNDASRPIFLERLGWHELWRGRVWVRPPLPPAGTAVGLDSIPAEVDGLDRSACGQIADADYLDWRYLRSPREYRVVGAFEGTRLRGLLAVRPRRGRVAVVCHALGEVGGLLRAIGCARPTIALVPRARRRAFLRAGYLPTPKSILVLGKQLRPEGSLAGEWQFQLGDFDIF
jgi:GNAT superfamily N-acetyltransferase